MLSFSMLFPVPTFPKLMIPLFQDLGDRWERQEKVKFASFLRVSVLLQALVPVFFHDVHQLLKKLFRPSTGQEIETKWGKNVQTAPSSSLKLLCRAKLCSLEFQVNYYEAFYLSMYICDSCRPPCAVLNHNLTKLGVAAVVSVESNL